MENSVKQTTNARTRKGAQNLRFKSSKLCREWQSNRTCRFGEQCRFLHDDQVALSITSGPTENQATNLEQADHPKEATHTQRANHSKKSKHQKDGKRLKEAQRQKWSMEPSKHEDVSRLLKDSNVFFDFHDIDDPAGSTREYDTNMMGRFDCPNPGCTCNGWSSKMIAITIRLYPGLRYTVRIYHQCCRGCGRLGCPKLKNSFEERVAYRLKKWSGVEVERPYYDNENKGPHLDKLCEGCKNGHCSKEKFGIRGYYSGFRQE